MIMFIMAGLYFFEDPETSSDPQVRVVIDIPAGLASACKCPEEGCDNSDCQWAGAICTGSCSAGELFACADEPDGDILSQTESENGQGDGGTVAPRCISACQAETKSVHDADYNEWLDRHLFGE